MGGVKQRGISATSATRLLSLRSNNDRSLFADLTAFPFLAKIVFYINTTVTLYICDQHSYYPLGSVFIPRFTCARLPGPNVKPNLVGCVMYKFCPDQHYFVESLPAFTYSFSHCSCFFRSYCYGKNTDSLYCTNRRHQPSAQGQLVGLEH